MFFIPNRVTFQVIYQVRLLFYHSNREIRGIQGLLQTGNVLYVNKYQGEFGSSLETEKVTIIRLADVYLIRAEARAKQDKVNEALTDVNVIRSRAGLPALITPSRQELLFAIEKERFMELCFEGHRWIDLVRTGRAVEVINQVKGIAITTDQTKLPIPQSEIELNSNLTQNPGY